MQTLTSADAPAGWTRPPSHEDKSKQSPGPGEQSKQVVRRSQMLQFLYIHTDCIPTMDKMDFSSVAITTKFHISLKSTELYNNAHYSQAFNKNILATAFISYCRNIIQSFAPEGSVSGD